MYTPQRHSRETAQSVASQMQPVLADLIALSLNVKQAHWHLRGPHFTPLHEQLDELVAAARRFADDIAERVVALSVDVDGRPSAVAEQTHVAETQPGFVDDSKVVESTVEQLDAVIERARYTLAPLDEIDLVTQDIIIELLRELEKLRWMFEAQLDR